MRQMGVAMHCGIFSFFSPSIKKLYLSQFTCVCFGLYTMASRRATRSAETEEDAARSSSRDEDLDNFEDTFNDPDYLPPSEPIDKAQWTRSLFSDDEDDDDDAREFLGFQDDWTSDSFNPRTKMNFIPTLIGLCKGMGILLLPVRRDYWTTKLRKRLCSRPTFRSRWPGTDLLLSGGKNNANTK